MKMLAAVLLRRICLKTIPKPENETGNNEKAKTDISYWMNIGSSARSFTENNLLIALANSSNSPSTKKIADAISELSKHIISKGGIVAYTCAFFDCGNRDIFINRCLAGTGYSRYFMHQIRRLLAKGIGLQNHCEFSTSVYPH